MLLELRELRPEVGLDILGRDGLAVHHGERLSRFWIREDREWHRERHHQQHCHRAHQSGTNRAASAVEAMNWMELH